FFSFSVATQVEPHNANLYYCWGEVLRFSGRSQEAIEKLTGACNRSMSDDSQWIFKMKTRFAQIEAGDADKLDREAQSQLDSGQPVGQWAPVKAAVEVSRGHFAEAANWLRKAQSAMNGNKEFAALLNDFIFRNSSWRDELKPLYGEKPQRQKVE